MGNAHISFNATRVLQIGLERELIVLKARTGAFTQFRHWWSRQTAICYLFYGRDSKDETEGLKLPEDGSYALYRKGKEDDHIEASKRREVNRK